MADCQVRCGFSSATQCVTKLHLVAVSEHGLSVTSAGYRCEGVKREYTPKLIMSTGG